MAIQTLSSVSAGLSEATTPDRQAARAEARLVKEQRDQELQRTQALQATPEQLGMEKDLQMQQLQLLQEQTRQQRKQAVRGRMFDAFDRFSSDTDARHLTTMIRDLRRDKLPMGPLQNIARVDNISEADRANLEARGLNVDLLLASPELKNNLVKTTDNVGNVEYRSVDRLKAVTGYGDYATSREVAKMKERAEIELILAKAASLNRKTSAGSDPSGISVSTQDEREAYRRALASLEQEGLALDSPAGARRFAALYNTEFNQIVTRDRQTATGKGQDVADQAIKELDRLSQEFDVETFEDIPADVLQANRAKFEPMIRRIETEGKQELSVSDKKFLRDTAKVIAAGDQAKELTSEETGVIDEKLNTLKTFVSDSVEGKQATAAYATIRNMYRNALFGATVPTGEMQQFDAMLSGLGRQSGPILAQLSVVFDQLKTELQQVVNQNNPQVLKFRFGMGTADIQRVVEGIDRRLEIIRAAESGEGFKFEEGSGPQRVLSAGGEQAPQQAPTDSQAALQAIFEEVSAQ